MTTNLLSTVEVEVPYRGPGNTVRNKPVIFDVIKNDDYYTAVPQLDQSELAVASLSPEISFRYERDMATPVRGVKDGNQHVIELIAEAWKAKNVI